MDSPSRWRCVALWTNGQFITGLHGAIEGKKSTHTHTNGQPRLDRMLGRQPRLHNPTSSGDTDWSVSVGGMAPLSHPLASPTKCFGAIVGLQFLRKEKQLSATLNKCRLSYSATSRMRKLLNRDAPAVKTNWSARDERNGASRQTWIQSPDAESNDFNKQEKLCIVIMRQYLKLLLLLIMWSTLRMTKVDFKTIIIEPTVWPALGPWRWGALMTPESSLWDSGGKLWNCKSLRRGQEICNTIINVPRPLWRIAFLAKPKTIQGKSKKKREKKGYVSLHFWALCSHFFYLTRLTAACNSPRKKKHEKKGK